MKRVAKARLPTDYGEFEMHAFENQIDKQTHVALVLGDIGDGADVLVRVHSQCLTGDVLHSLSAATAAAQLDARACGDRGGGRGVLLYLNQEGRGIGLANKIRAYELQDQGLDTVRRTSSSASRPTSATTASASRFCASSACAAMRLLTNNPRKLSASRATG